MGPHPSEQKLSFRALLGLITINLLVLTSSFALCVQARIYSLFPAFFQVAAAAPSCGASSWPCGGSVSAPSYLFWGAPLFFTLSMGPFRILALFLLLAGVYARVGPQADPFGCPPPLAPLRASDLPLRILPGRGSVWVLSVRGWQGVLANPSPAKWQHSHVGVVGLARSREGAGSKGPGGDPAPLNAMFKPTLFLSCCVLVNGHPPYVAPVHA